MFRTKNFKPIFHCFYKLLNANFVVGILPEAIRTNCLRCTEKQRYVVVKSIRRLKKEYPKVWEELSAIWDPTGEYFQKLEDSLTVKPIIERYPEQQNKSTIPPAVTIPSFISSTSPAINTSPSVVKKTEFPTIINSTEQQLNISTQPEVILVNRFSENGDTVTSSVSTKPSASSVLTTVVSTSKLRPSSTGTKVTSYPSSTIRPYFPFNRYPTKQPYPHYFTVSLDPSMLIVEPLKKISNLGTQVVKTGAKLADAVVATVQNVLGR